MQRIVFVTLMIVMLCSCAHRKFQATTIDVSEGVSLPLLKPSSFGQSVSLVQSADIKFEQQHHQLLLQVEITSQRIIVVGLSPNGTRLFTTEYDGLNLKSEGFSQLVEKIDPRYLIADIQFSIWPLKVLEMVYTNQSTCFINRECQILQDEQLKIRSLQLSNESVVEVKYQSAINYQSELEFANLSRGYNLLITPLSMENISE